MKVGHMKFITRCQGCGKRVEFTHVITLGCHTNYDCYIVTAGIDKEVAVKCHECWYTNNFILDINDDMDISTEIFLKV